MVERLYTFREVFEGHEDFVIKATEVYASLNRSCQKKSEHLEKESVADGGRKLGG